MGCTLTGTALFLLGVKVPKYLKSYRNKEKARICRNRRRKRNYNKSAATAVNGKCRWSVEDVVTVMEHRINDAGIAKLIGRSVEAIQIKRSRVIAKNREAHPIQEPE